MAEVLLGEGELTWGRHERIGDRYGSVFLDPGVLRLGVAQERAGARGTLKVEITENGVSDHIGDLFHGLFPPGPDNVPPVGSVVKLGHGDLFVDADEEYPAIGLRPDRPYEGTEEPLPADREVFWLDPVALYRVHSQTVRLLFVPDNADQEVMDP